MRVLISGAGIAGSTLAYWLARHGMQPTLVEKAPRLRTGGYVIDFWGAGFEIADRMGLLPEITLKGYKVQELRVVDRAGKKIAGFPVDAFARVTNGRFITLPRGDLAASIFGLLEEKVETIFGDSIARIDQSDKGVHVAFESGAERDFDLSSERTGFTRESVKSFSARKTALRSIWDVKWRLSRSRATGRETSSFTFSTQRWASRWAALLCAAIALCSCSRSLMQIPLAPVNFQPKKRCCGAASERVDGSARGFWTLLTARTISISIASARYAWMIEKDYGLRDACAWSGMRPPASRCSQGKVRLWPWSQPISWQENFIAQTGTTPRPLLATRTYSARLFAENKKRRCALPVSSHPNLNFLYSSAIR